MAHGGSSCCAAHKCRAHQGQLILKSASPRRFHFTAMPLLLEGWAHITVLTRAAYRLRAYQCSRLITCILWCAGITTLRLYPCSYLI